MTTRDDIPPPPAAQQPPPSSLWRMRAVLPGGLEITFPQVLLVAGIVFTAIAWPGDFKYKLDALGFGVCHQIHSHSITIAGHQLPLCARCTGIYLGAILALAIMVRLRRRAIRLPSGMMLPVLGIFFLSMAADGLNSMFQSTGAGQLWETTNVSRVVTGALAGLSVAFLFYPVFNMSLWHREVRSRESVLDHPLELLAYLLGAGLLVALALDGGDWLFYPLAVVSILGMLMLLTMANTMLVLLATRREGIARTASQIVTPVLVGVVLSLAMLALLGWGRASFAPLIGAHNPLGLPLVAGLP